MNYVFFGTPEFAAIILGKLIQGGFIPAAVVCNPDRPVGRKKVITAPAVKILAQKYNIKIWQPESLKIENWNLEFGEIDFDFAVVAAYAKILPKEMLDIPRLGTIGVHPSLLPKYRGSSPIQSAILGGEKETGVTLYLMDEKMDHGEIISKIKSQMSKNDTYTTLMQKLAASAGDLLVETLPKFVSDEIKPVPQDESKATYTKKFERKDAFIEPNDLESAQAGTNPIKTAEIERKIRAFDPEPGAWTLQQAQGKLKQVKLLAAEVWSGKLVLKKTQIEGEKPKTVN